MSGLSIFDLAARQAAWLATRQAAVSENIANANTPGYAPKDVKPFVDQLAGLGATLLTTSTRHMQADNVVGAVATMNRGAAWDRSHSGNSVRVDQELIKASEVRSGYALNVAVTRAFSRMFLEAVKS